MYYTIIFEASIKKTRQQTLRHVVPKISWRKGTISKKISLYDHKEYHSEQLKTCVQDVSSTRVFLAFSRSFCFVYAESNMISKV
jgi:hypothetical protein